MDGSQQLSECDSGLMAHQTKGKQPGWRDSKVENLVVSA